MVPFVLLSVAADALNLDDIGATKRRARQLLDGPDSCIEVQAEAAVKVALMTPGGVLGSSDERVYSASGTVFGTLDHGTWTSWGPALHDDQPNDDLALGDVKARPMVGKSAKEDGKDEGEGSVSLSAGSSGTSVAATQSGAQAINILDEILDEVNPAVSTAYVEPDGTGYALVEHADIKGQDEDLEMRWHIEPTGLPTALDVTFPKRLKLGDGIVKVRVLNGQLHLRGGTTQLGTLPTRESLSVVVGALGFTVGVEQEIKYVRARPCGS